MPGTSRGRIRVGTSGWSYDHWRDVFYPPKTPSAKRLAYYATRLSTVEINASFYRTPSAHAVTVWKETAPAGFAYAVKGSRYITHFHKLDDVEDSLALFFDRIGGLGDTLEVVLWQLPEQLHIDVERLSGFLGQLPQRVRHAVEFRHESWLTPEVFETLRSHNVANVQIDSVQMPRNLTVTADFVYVRFHGSSYHGEYTAPLLKPWTKFLAENAAEGRGGYVYFNNDAGGHAPVDAERLVGLLGEDAYPWPAATGAG